LAAKKVLPNKVITKKRSSEFYDYIKTAFSETVLNMAAAKIEQLQKGLKDQAERADELEETEPEDTGIITYR
jgi:hypothetical protein